MCIMTPVRLPGKIMQQGKAKDNTHRKLHTADLKVLQLKILCYGYVRTRKGARLER